MMPTDEEIHQAGEETPQDAAETTDEQTPLAETPDVEAGQEQEPKHVPLAALEDERAKRQAAQQQLQQYQQMLMQQAAMQQAMQGQSASAPQQQPPDVLSQIGIQPDDLYTTDGVRKFASGIDQLVRRQVEEATRRVRAEIEGQQFNQQAADYADLVGTQGPFGFQPAEPLQRALRDHPGLEQELLAIGDPMVQRKAAYRYAAMARKIMDLEAGQSTTRDIATQVAAKTAPMSAAAAGSGGAFTKARALAEMSDEEFDRLDREAASTG